MNYVNGVFISDIYRSVKIIYLSEQNTAVLGSWWCESRSDCSRAEAAAETASERKRERA